MTTDPKRALRKWRISFQIDQRTRRYDARQLRFLPGVLILRFGQIETIVVFAGRFWIGVERIENRRAGEVTVSVAWGKCYIEKNGEITQ